jgi:hypothetical protein
MGTDIESFTKKHFDIDCLYHRQGNEQKQVAAGADPGIQVRGRT